MKYIASALVLLALIGEQNTQAIRIKQNNPFSDDLVKSLAEEMNKDESAGDKETGR